MLTNYNDDNISIASINGCCICLGSLKDSKYKLACKHEFHKSCIDGWLKNNLTCPMCRSHVVINIPKVKKNKVNVQQNTILLPNNDIKKKRLFIFFIITVFLFVISCIFNIYQFFLSNNHINNYIKNLNETQLGNNSNLGYNTDIIIFIDFIYLFLFFICCLNILNKNNKVCCGIHCASVILGILLITNLIIRFEFLRLTNKFLQDKEFNFDSSYYNYLSLSIILYVLSYFLKIVSLIIYCMNNS